jgi:Sec-independent protein translocase protein TatA
MLSRPDGPRFKIELWHLILINVIALVLFVVAYKMHGP